MNKYHALFVEDDADIQHYLMEILKDYFFDVLSASNGVEALEIFNNNKIDVLITDISMPKMNGLELIRNLKVNSSNLPVIVMSAYSDTEYFTKAISLGIDGYILKPIDMMQLDCLLNKVIERLNDHDANIKNSKLLNEYKDTIDISTIISKTDLNGKITYVNDAFIQLTGYSKDELIGSYHKIVRHPDTSDAVFKDMWTTILNKKIWKGLVKNKKKNNDLYWVDITIKPILDEYDNIVEFIAIRTDVTVEVEYKLKLEQTVAQKVELLRQKDKILEHQSKLAAMGDMIDAIAHQWKQPINVIKLNTDMLGYDYKDGILDDRVLETFQNSVYFQINHMVETLEEFRSFLRPNKSTKEFTVVDTINSALLLIKDELIKNNIDIKLEVLDDIIIDGIENEFIHVVLNIINNSKDAFIEKNIQEKEIKIILKKEQNKRIIMICDNAGGIPSELINKIFEAHITTKDMATGTGIGLYMSKQIIEKIGAKIKVENKNNGACFTISI